jgi:hypothetical protein
VKEAVELEPRTGIGVERSGCLSKNLDGKVKKMNLAFHLRNPYSLTTDQGRLRNFRHRLRCSLAQAR